MEADYFITVEAKPHTQSHHTQNHREGTNNYFQQQWFTHLIQINYNTKKLCSTRINFP